MKRPTIWFAMQRILIPNKLISLAKMYGERSRSYSRKWVFWHFHNPYGSETGSGMSSIFFNLDIVKSTKRLQNTNWTNHLSQNEYSGFHRRCVVGGGDKEMFGKTYQNHYYKAPYYKCTLHLNERESSCYLLILEKWYFLLIDNKYTMCKQLVWNYRNRQKTLQIDKGVILSITRPLNK